MAKDKKGNMNRLADSGSPYLRQHANNPVDWRPWSEEAFEEAARLDKPVFLSIGYSTCHWCHVMERESFSDPDVAALMNENFVCVKVDREERPDVDHLYMTVCQLLTGSGGWPLTIIMTPDRKPFFAGTYFPRGDDHGRPGMLQLIPRVRELWTRERDAVNTSAREISEGLQAFMAPDNAFEPARDLPERTFLSLREQYDPEYGGFGSAPKFPVFSNLLFLLGYWKRTGDEKPLPMVQRTLAAMRRGGIFDQVGYGIHRYSVDKRWFSPHFEKMLYDQALAVITCTDAFLASGEDNYRKMAGEIIEYVLRDLQSPEGGFYSAEDADSEGEEGRFYTWAMDELVNILSREETAVIREVFNATDEGNFRTETGDTTGRNILHLIARSSGAIEEPWPDRIHEQTAEKIRQKLLNARSSRVRPMRDDKIMADWNGLMITALAKAARALGEDRYTEAALKALAYIMDNLLGADNSLLHLRYSDGHTVPAFLDDHAYMLWALLELHQTTFNTDHLETALNIADDMVKLFHDDENGGFFLARKGGDPATDRLKTSFDGPMPSGNSAAAMALVRLGRLTARRDLEEAGHGTFRAFAAEMAGNPSGHSFMVSALDMASRGTSEVILVGDPVGKDTAKLLQALNRSYLPGMSALLLNPDDPDPRILKLMPYARDMKTVNGKAAAYVCRDFVCQAPVTSADGMLKAFSHPKDPVK